VSFFNSMENTAVETFAAPVQRPSFVGARAPFEPVR